MINGFYLKLTRNDYRRWIGFFLSFIAIFNFVFGLMLLTSIISKYEKRKILSEPNLHQENQKTRQTQFKIHYQHYFRIDYTIKDDVCVPIHMFNTTKNILSIQNLTNFKLKSLLSRDLPIITDIISLNTIHKKSETNSNNMINNNNTKVGCNYVLKLQIGLSYPSFCDQICQLEQHRYLTCQIRPFDDSINNSFKLKFYLFQSIILFNIHQVLLMESSIYHEKSVYIRSYYSNNYWLELILDAEGSQLSIIMSNKSRSLFIIKDGIYKNSSELLDNFHQNRLLIKKIKENIIRDKNPIELMNSLNKKINQTICSSLFISFLSTHVSNSYVKSQDERIVLKRILQTSKMKQESTFILIFSKTNKNMVAFRASNIEHTYIAADPITPKGLILAKPNVTHSNIDFFEKHFLFKLIYDQEEEEE